MSTTPTTEPPADPFAPPPPTRRSWYRRHSVLLSTAVTAIVAVTVITDLPTTTTRSGEIATARSAIAEISSDAEPCNLGMTESFGFYTDVTTGHITAAHRAQIPALIRDDLAACSYTNQSIDDLAAIDTHGTAWAHQVNGIANDVLLWCDPDALTAIGEITTLLDHPRDSAATARLLAAERLLTSDRTHAFRAIRELATTLGASLPSKLHLVKVP